MKLIKLLQDKNYAELRDYVDGRIGSIVSGKIMSRKNDILNKVRGIVVAEDETIEVTIKNDKDKDGKKDDEDKDEKKDSDKDDKDEKKDSDKEEK